LALPNRKRASAKLGSFCRAFISSITAPGRSLLASRVLPDWQHRVGTLAAARDQQCQDQRQRATAYRRTHLHFDPLQSATAQAMLAPLSPFLPNGRMR
jgi:hypothetical protein